MTAEEQPLGMSGLPRISSLSESLDAVGALDEAARARFLAEAAAAGGDTYYILRVFPEVGFEFISDSVFEHTGYTSEQILSDPELMLRVVHPEDVATFAEALTAPVGTDVRIELRWEGADGRTVWTDHRAKSRQRPDGTVVLEGSSRDVTDLRAAQMGLEASEARYRHVAAAAQRDRARLRATMDSLMDPHVVLESVRDENGQIIDFVYVDANKAACELNGLSLAELTGTCLLTLLPGMGPFGLLAQFIQLVETGEPLILDGVPFAAESGDPPKYFLDMRGIRLGDGFSLTWRDVTDRQSAVQELKYRATHDGLTGLLNRDAVTARLENILAGQQRKSDSVAILFCDVDNLRSTNDEYGHLAGDALLKAVSASISACVRTGDLVGRFGGDEFVVILSGVHGVADAERVAATILAAAAHPVTHLDVALNPSLSIGLALAREGQGVDDIIREADSALYTAKRNGRNQIVTFGVDVTEN
ncbi:MAG: diguanylate cyclase [Actinobacteria bacterium]|nr:diguanylate cyclase [Actinomycetota bacterium]